MTGVFILLIIGNFKFRGEYMITKSSIAAILGLDASDISDSIYTWSVKQFFILTGFNETSVQKVERSLMQSSSNVFKLKRKDIKTIDVIKIDNTIQSFTLHSDLKLNPDSGFLWFASGFGSGQLVEITYTLNSFTHEDIHDYLVSLLVAKALALFSPEKISQVKMVKIGNFQKQYGSSSSNLEEFISVTDGEVKRVIGLILGDDGGIGLGLIQ